MKTKTHHSHHSHPNFDSGMVLFSLKNIAAPQQRWHSQAVHEMCFAVKPATSLSCFPQLNPIGLKEACLQRFRLAEKKAKL